MHHMDPALFAAVADKVVARVHEFKPQELANLVWSFASLGFVHTPLVSCTRAAYMHSKPTPSMPLHEMQQLRVCLE